MKKSGLSFLFILTLLGVLFWQYCGKTPSSLPLPYTGSIYITAMDTAVVDSVQIDLDDEYLGEMENPCLVEDVVIGLHRLHVYNEASAGTTITNLEVLQDETTRMFFTMDIGPEVGPYVGNTAPQFTTQNVEGNKISLEDQKGKVVLLVFFEYT